MTIDKKALNDAEIAYTANGDAVVTECLRAAILAYLEAAREGEPVASLSGDDLYVRVPREPTREMLDAAENVYSVAYTGTPVASPGSVYAAMLAAAPASPDEGKDIRKAMVKALRSAEQALEELKPHTDRVGEKSIIEPTLAILRAALHPADQPAEQTHEARGWGWNGDTCAVWGKAVVLGETRSEKEQTAKIIATALATHPSPEAREAEAVAWRLEVKFGPEGEEFYSWVYKGQDLVCTTKTHLAKEIVAAMNATPPDRKATPSLQAESVVRRWRHKKRGSTYIEIGRGKIQAEGWLNCPHGAANGGDPVDMAYVVVYRAEEDGSLWVRPVAEFEDGRFEDIAALHPADQPAEEYEKCPSCEGSGLQLGGTGEPTECRECKGNTVVATPSLQAESVVATNTNTRGAK